MHCHHSIVYLYNNYQDDSFKLHGIEECPSKEVELTREDVLSFYRQMNAIREMELAARELYQAKKIRGFLHLFVGQVSSLFIQPS